MMAQKAGEYGRHCTHFALFQTTTSASRMTPRSFSCLVTNLSRTGVARVLSVLNGPAAVVAHLLALLGHHVHLHALPCAGA